jgi:ribosomal 50S subunit-recycling heat shock protein
LTDPKPIALPTVDRLTPLARSGLEALLPNGNVVKARVLAMLAQDVAQLEINGQKVEVSTPQALKVGTTLNVAINRTGRSLELVIRPDTNNSHPPPASVPGRPYGAQTIGSAPPLAVSIEDWVLAAQAAINEAVLSGEANFQSANLASAQPSSKPVIQPSYPAAGFPAQAQLQAEVRARYGLDASPSASSLREENLDAPSSAYEASSLTPQPAVSSFVSDQPASNSALAIVAPFQLQQMQHPILMTIRQDDEDEARPARRSPAAKRWTVNFSLDPGTIGPVHITIGLSASAVSVRLSSDQAESAFFLSAWLPELKATLEHADFAVEELSVRESARSDMAANAPDLL